MAAFRASFPRRIRAVAGIPKETGRRCLPGLLPSRAFSPSARATACSHGTGPLALQRDDVPARLDLRASRFGWIGLVRLRTACSPGVWHLATVTALRPPSRGAGSWIHLTQDAADTRRRLRSELPRSRCSRGTNPDEGVPSPWSRWPSRGVRAGESAEAASRRPLSASPGVARRFEDADPEDQDGHWFRPTRAAFRRPSGGHPPNLAPAEAGGRPPVRSCSPSETCPCSPAPRRPRHRSEDRGPDPTRNAASPGLSCPTTRSQAGGPAA
jgi:hypothetical protein